MNGHPVNHEGGKEKEDGIAGKNDKGKGS